MNILKIKVIRGQRRIPFDLFYLVHKDDRSFIPRMFTHSICVPPNEHTNNALSLLYRDKVFKITQEGGNKIQLRKDASLRKYLQNSYTFSDFFIVVPILPTRGDTHYKPAYVISQRGYDPVYDRVVKSILTDAAVLFTPEKNYRPICLACPNKMLKLQEECFLGSDTCYDALILGKVTNEQLQRDSCNGDSCT